MHGKVSLSGGMYGQATAVDGSKMRTPGKQGYIPSTLCEIPSNTPAGTSRTENQILHDTILSP